MEVVKLDTAELWAQVVSTFSLLPERCGESPPSPSTLHTAPSQQHLLVSLFPPDWKQFKSRVYVVSFQLEGLAQSLPRVDIQ